MIYEGIVGKYRYEMQRATTGGGFIGYVYSPGGKKKSVIIIYNDGFIHCERPHAVPLKVRAAIKEYMNRPHKI